MDLTSCGVTYPRPFKKAWAVYKKRMGFDPESRDDEKRRKKANSPVSYVVKA